MSDPLTIDVQRSGKRFDAEALLDLPAPAQTVWDTITDYDALPRFMPGIRACRVLERHPGAGGAERLVVEQHGEFRFLLFAQAMRVRLHIAHETLRVAEAKAVSFELGLLRRRAVDVFEGRYEILRPSGHIMAGTAPHTQLRYTARIELHLPPPPTIGSLAVRQNLQAQLEALAREVRRRGG